MRAWRVTEFGAPADVLALEEVPDPEPGAGEVRIRTEAITLNFNDIDGIHGRYRTIPAPAPYTPGMEVVGVIDAAGPGAESRVGERVAAITSGALGGYAELALAPTTMTFSLPEALPLPEAAAIVMPFHLAWLGVRVRGAVTAGETLLVHAGAGGVGSAAIQLGVDAGARVIATAGSSEKTRLCAELGADLAVDYRATDFADAVLEATAGRGVDVAFDTIGGAVTTQTFRCMSFGGRHVLAGFAAGIEAEDEGIVPRPVLFGNFSLVGVCLAYVDDPLEVKRATGSNFAGRADAERYHAEILDRIGRGTVRPVVGLEVPFAELPGAVASLEARDTVGRVVVRVG